MPGDHGTGDEPEFATIEFFLHFSVMSNLCGRRQWTMVYGVAYLKISPVMCAIVRDIFIVIPWPYCSPSSSSLFERHTTYNVKLLWNSSNSNSSNSSNQIGCHVAWTAVWIWNVRTHHLLPRVVEPAKLDRIPAKFRCHRRSRRAGQFDKFIECRTKLLRWLDVVGVLPTYHANLMVFMGCAGNTFIC